MHVLTFATRLSSLFLPPPPSPSSFSSPSLSLRCARRDSIQPHEITLVAAYAASSLTRTASRLTFAKHKRAMQTGEMLGFVGEAFEEVFGADAVADEGAGATGALDKLVTAIKGSL